MIAIIHTQSLIESLRYATLADPRGQDPTAAQRLAVSLVKAHDAVEADPEADAMADEVVLLPAPLFHKLFNLAATQQATSDKDADADLAKLFEQYPKLVKEFASMNG